MRKKNIHFDHIGSVMTSLLGDFMGKIHPELLRIHSAWSEIVEKQVAENSMPAAMKGKVLIVHVTSSIWLQELHFSKKEILHNINRKIGSEAVEEIKFKIGSVS